MGRTRLEPATFCTSSIVRDDNEELINRFREFLVVDMRRDKKTVYEHTYYIGKFLEQLTKPVSLVIAEDIREYLKSLNGAGTATYKNTLGALKLFFRDFLAMPQAVSSFKFPRQGFKPKHILTKQQVQRFYNDIETSKERALFMIYATSGLRRSEALSLKTEDIDFNTRMIIPNCHSGETKKSWLSFYNEETEKVLKSYLASKKPTRSLRLFPMPREEEKQLWKIAKEKSGLNVTPQRLREWFCSAMLSQGISDSYVDAFCGRTPKSVLAKHYTDYSPEKLREIYDKANLKVLSG